MRTLFLDIDGVLHGVTSNQEGRWIAGEPLNKVDALADLLERIADPINLEIVISSTWRLDGLEVVCTKIPRLAPWIVDCTDTTRLDNRFDEIIDYVQKRGIRDWRALDDDVSPFSGHPNLIACDEAVGIQEDQLCKLSAWLESPPVR